MGATMEDVPVLAMEEGCLDLPPGFRFHPTDEEIITHYLLEKARNEGFSSGIIGDVDLNKSEPWELPSKAKMGEKEWYFFCHRDRKYPTGMRTNRATEAGYWKATGKDKEIYKGRNCLVGMKKTLVFYKGRAPKGEKTNWVMHEYRLEGKSFYHNLPKALKDAWVVCRVFHKNAAGAKRIPSPLAEAGRVDPIFVAKPSFEDDYLRSPPMPPLTESPYGSSSKLGSCFMDDGSDGGDFKPAPSSSPNPFYLPSMGSFQDLQNCFLDNNIIPFPDYNNINPINPQVNNLQNPPQASVFSPQAAFPSPSRSLQSSPNVGVYPPHATLRAQAAPQEREGTALGRQYYYNAEPQYSNQTSWVTASQDTALSADRNAEISSVFSKPGGAVGSSRPPHDDVGLPSTSAGQLAYPGSLWKY